MTEIQTYAVLVAGLFLSPVLLFLLLFFFATYRLGRHEVEVLLFDRVIRHLPLHQIDDVIVGGRFPCELWPSSHLFRRRFLSIRKKRGILRYLVICPPNPEKFRANVYYALGWNPEESQGN